MDKLGGKTTAPLCDKDVAWRGCGFFIDEGWHRRCYDVCDEKIKYSLSLDLRVWIKKDSAIFV